MMDEPAEIHVDCLEHGLAWECRVIIGDPERDPEYVVGVTRGELEKYARGGTEPTGLVEESFRFLLEREPASSILRRFNLSDIERYYPEYRELILWRTAEKE
jgi:hypothetical protein